MGGIKRKRKKCKDCQNLSYIWAYNRCKKCDSIYKAKNKKVKSNKEVKKDSDEKSQLDIFNEIWEEREHFSWISKKPLYGKDHPFWIWQFEHVLTKGAYPKYKFEKKNIILITPEEHFDLTNNSCKEKEIYKTYFSLVENLKEEYHKEKMK